MMAPGGKIDSFSVGTSARDVTPKVKAITAALAISVLVLVISRLLSPGKLSCGERCSGKKIGADRNFSGSRRETELSPQRNARPRLYLLGLVAVLVLVRRHDIVTLLVGSVAGRGISAGRLIDLVRVVLRVRTLIFADMRALVRAHLGRAGGIAIVVARGAIVVCGAVVARRVIVGRVIVGGDDNILGGRVMLHARCRGIPRHPENQHPRGGSYSQL